MQVLVIDWSAGAADNFPVAGLNGSKWIPPVAHWVQSQLRHWGVAGSTISLFGHSWGAYVSYEVARELGGVQSIVALDPAKDTVVLGSGYPEGAVRFGDVSNLSYAFHSSFFGNEHVAQTADYSFSVEPPREGYEGVEIGWITDEILDAWREHGFAVTMVSALLRERSSSPGGFQEFFSLERLTRTPATVFTMQPGQHEGKIRVSAARTMGREGVWWKASAISVEPYTLAEGDASGSSSSS
jgi:pimeloyl-ACP methyl ester carboxylesterase